MTDELSQYLDWLDAGGMTVDRRQDPERERDLETALLPRGVSSRACEAWPGNVIHEVLDPAAGLGADHATLAVCAALRSRFTSLAGKQVVDLGCGTGILAVAAAQLGGTVTACDIDPAALALARTTAAANGVTLDLLEGSLLDPLPADLHVDLFLSNLPHKPAPAGSPLPVAMAGGVEGDALWSRAAPRMAAHQRRGDLLLFFLHSLPHPRLLGTILGWWDLRLLSWKVRWFQDDEFGPLRDSFRTRHRAGTSFLVTSGDREGFVACVWEARRNGEPAP